MHLTKKQVVAYHNFMATRFGAYYFDSTEPQERAIRALNRICPGISKNLPRNWSITLDNFIHLSYEIGEGNQAELCKQLEVMAHECHHVTQYRLHGAADFIYQYTTDPVFRAKMEAKALLANLDLYFKCHGKTKSVPAIIKSMDFYILPQADLRTIAKKLEMANEMITKMQKPISITGKVAVAWLDENVA